MDALRWDGCSKMGWTLYDGVDALRWGGCSTMGWMLYDGVDALRWGGCSTMGYFTNKSFIKSATLIMNQILDIIV